MSTVEERLQHIEDDLAIRTLAARFADTSTRNDLADFKTLWTPDAAWIISRPYAAKCQGIDEIMALIQTLENGKEFFVHFLHSGVINVDGDRATARWIIHEVAKGAGGVYTRPTACSTTRWPGSRAAGGSPAANGRACTWTAIRSPVRGTSRLNGP